MIVLGTYRPCWSNKKKIIIKNEIQRSTWNILWKCCVWSRMCTRHKSLCLEESIWLWIYLPNFKSNQNWLLRIQKPLESQRIVGYNLTETILMFLWFYRWWKRSVSKTENTAMQKLTLHHWYLSKWLSSKNSKRSEFLNILFTKAPCWLRYNQREVPLFSFQSFLSRHNHTWRSSFGNQQRVKLLISSQHVFSWSKLW